MNKLLLINNTKLTVERERGKDLIDNSSTSYKWYERLYLINVDMLELLCRLFLYLDGRRRRGELIKRRTFTGIANA